MSRFRTSNNGNAHCPPPQAPPIATCREGRDLPFPGREFPGSLDFGRPVIPLIVSGKAELLLPDAGAPLLYIPRQTLDATSDPFRANVVATLDVPSGHQASRAVVATSISNPLLGEQVEFALYSGSRRVVQFSGHTNHPIEVPLQHRDAAGARTFSLRAALAGDGLNIRTQVIAYGTIALYVLGDTPLDASKRDCAKGAAR